MDIVIDYLHNMYVADNKYDRILKLDSRGQFLAYWGGTGTANGQLNGPFGLVFDSQNNLYVVEYWNNRVQKFSSDGTWILSWGIYGTGQGQFRCV